MIDIRIGDCRDGKGRFTKGHHPSPNTEFKKGHHWREPKPYWNSEWLKEQYIDQQRSASHIAEEQGCNENNILYFLNKFNIPTRPMSEIRAIKSWASVGERNGMYGRIEKDNPNWRGGITPERQDFCSSLEWKQAVQEISERDRVCQVCGAKNDGKRQFHIHHIFSFAVKELRVDPDNLVLLCRECHRWIHSNKNKDGILISAYSDIGNKHPDTYPNTSVTSVTEEV